jgi:hypothetical protein
MKIILRLIFPFSFLLFLSCPSDTYDTCSADFNLILHNNALYTLNCVITYSYTDYSRSVSEEQELITKTVYYNNLGPSSAATVKMKMSWEVNTGYRLIENSDIDLYITGNPVITGTQKNLKLTIQDGRQSDGHAYFE